MKCSRIARAFAVLEILAAVGLARLAYVLVLEERYNAMRDGTPELAQSWALDSTVPLLSLSFALVGSSICTWLGAKSTWHYWFAAIPALVSTVAIVMFRLPEFVVCCLILSLILAQSLFARR